MYIIAEIGSNHNGDLNQALTLINLAKECGADAVKFQSYHAEKLVHPQAMALPQAKGYTKQIDRFRDLQFTKEQWDRVIHRCKEVQIDFLTTPFDLESLDQFKSHMKYIKVSSGDLTHHRLLRAISATGKPVILSTGMASMSEIEDAARLFNPTMLTVCHCVSLYPCPDEEANLGVIDDLLERFSSVGYSDHTIGITASLVAAGKGCRVIEKHFTLDSSLDFGDHPLSSDPDEFAELVSHLRRIECMSGKEKPSIHEGTTLRRGAYAKHKIEVGQIIGENDIIELRPQINRRPFEVIGTRARKTYEELDPIG